MERLVCLLIGYAFGLFQTGYFYGKHVNVDIRQHGSGNAGTTNALRTLGWKAGVITLLGDCFKCVAAIALTRVIFADSNMLALLAMYAGAGVILGHNFPFYLNFKGGKGIAATAGLLLATNGVMTGIALVVFVTTVALTRYVSLGSILVVILFLIEVVVYGQHGGFALSTPHLYELYILVLCLTILAIWKHRTNIVRLLNGTENKFGVGKKQANV